MYFMIIPDKMKNTFSKGIIINPKTVRHNATVAGVQISKFVIIKTLEIYPNLYIATGRVKTVALNEMTTAQNVLNKNLFLIYSFSFTNSVIGAATAKIPNVDKTDNWNATLKIDNGLLISIRLTAAPKVFEGVLDLLKSNETDIKIYVTPALNIDIVKPHTAATVSTAIKVMSALK